MVRSSNRNWRFILICIDVFSRKLYAEPQQDKTPGETLTSFKKILERAGARPSEVDSDEAQEFKGAFDAFLDSRGIGHMSRDPRQSNALAIVDSAIRTLKIIMSRGMTARKTGSWANVLQQSVTSYNNRPHESLMDTKPRDVDKNDTLRYDLEAKAGRDIAHNVDEGNAV